MSIWTSSDTSFNPERINSLHLVSFEPRLDWLQIRFTMTSTKEIIWEFQTKEELEKALKKITTTII